MKKINTIVSAQTKFAATKIQTATSANLDGTRGNPVAAAPKVLVNPKTKR